SDAMRKARRKRFDLKDIGEKLDEFIDFAADGVSECGIRLCVKVFLDMQYATRRRCYHIIIGRKEPDKAFVHIVGEMLESRVRDRLSTTGLPFRIVHIHAQF